jgi:hypothetical protein
MAGRGLASAGGDCRPQPVGAVHPVRDSATTPRINPAGEPRDHLIAVMRASRAAALPSEINGGLLQYFRAPIRGRKMAGMTEAALVRPTGIVLADEEVRISAIRVGACGREPISAAVVNLHV